MFSFLDCLSELLKFLGNLMIFFRFQEMTHLSEYLFFWKRIDWPLIFGKENSFFNCFLCLLVWFPWKECREKAQECMVGYIGLLQEKRNLSF